MSVAAIRRPIALRKRGERDSASIAPHELFWVALQGLRQRRLRAALSALGIWSVLAACAPSTTVG